jgi:AcrR family transcriptional regulator
VVRFFAKQERLPVVYRRTERMTRRLAARREAIVAAAAAAAAEGGMAAVQIAPVAARADIASGTVYRYFPAKTDLVAAVVAALAEREIAAIRAAADAAPGPLSALAAAVATFAMRAMRRRRLTWALIAEPVDADVDAARVAYRKLLVAEFAARIAGAVASGHVPEQDAETSAVVLLGGLIEGLVGPLASDPPVDTTTVRAAVQSLTLLSLRALGVADARARGLVVQTALPIEDDAA